MMISKPKGTYDVIPSDISKWHYLEDVIMQVSKIYNYKEIRTPMFESRDLFHRSVGESSDIVSKETYDFKDRGNREITLRPEGTAGVVRSFIENKLYANPMQPTKVYYIGPMFRYERPQKGRTRQFTQFGLEAFGSFSPMIDAEVIAYVVTLLRALKIDDVKVRLNSLGDDESRELYKEALINYFRPNIDKLCNDCKNRFDTNPLRILDCKVDSDNEVLLNAPKAVDFLNESSKNHFEGVIKYLDAMGIDYYLDSKLVRGLDYYTHTVFEVEANLKTLGSQNAIGAGGRYNNLVESLGGPSVPAVGFAFGMERLLLALESVEKEEINDGIHLYIMALGDKTKEVAVNLLNNCRLGGLISDIGYFDKGLKAQFKQADRLNAKYIAILGENELENKSINVKNVETGIQETIKYEDLYKYIVSSLRNNQTHSHSCGGCKGENHE